jgi:hypothetical protein
MVPGGERNLILTELQTQVFFFTFFSCLGVGTRTNHCLKTSVKFTRRKGGLEAVDCTRKEMKTVGESYYIEVHCPGERVTQRVRRHRITSFIIDDDYPNYSHRLFASFPKFS